MKSKQEIQRTWDAEWFTPLADLEGLSFEVIVGIKTEIRKEVYWLVTLPRDQDAAAALQIRIDKIQAIMDANDGSASSFDVYFAWRKAFFEWCLT